MTLQEFEKLIQEIKVIPVVTIENCDNIDYLCSSLINGNLPLIEIAFRNENAFQAVKIIKQKYPQIIVGAGTILSKSMAQKALSIGVDFIVSPGLDINTINYCKKKKIAFIPGVATPSEIQTCINHKIFTMKLFPCNALGGINYINAITAPFTKIKLIPTGGITQEDYKTYLQNKNVIAVGGSWMVSQNLQKQNNWQTITNMCKQITQKELV